MLPEPLHAAVVHFPIALACLAPFAGIAAVLAIRRGAAPRIVWGSVVLLLALLAGSAWLATETGERDEERVEKVVAERLLEDHEEGGKRFLILAVVALVVSTAGLLPGRGGALARVVTLVATLLPVAGAIDAGHTGGELVYRHGAASAYSATAAAVPRGAPTDGE